MAERSNVAVSYLGRSWFILSNITSAIGVISLVDDLNSWTVAIGLLMKWLLEHLPPIHDIFLIFAQALHWVIEIFRSVIHPIFRFLFQWVPFEIPGVLLDLSLVVSLSLGGVLRARYVVQSKLNAARAAFERDLRKELAADGIKKAFSWIFTQLMSYRDKNDSKNEAELKQVLGNKLEEYFERFDRYAYAKAVETAEFEMRTYEVRELGVVRFWTRLSAALCGVVFMDFMLFTTDYLPLPSVD